MTDTFIVCTQFVADLSGNYLTECLILINIFFFVYQIRETLKIGLDVRVMTYQALTARKLRSPSKRVYGESKNV